MSDSILSDDDDRSLAERYGSYETYGMDEAGGDPGRDVDDEQAVRETIRASRPYWLTAVPVVLILVAGTLIFLSIGDTDRGSTATDQSGAALQSEIVSPDDSAGTATEGDEEATSTAADGQADPADETAETDGAQIALPAPPTGAPYVDATLSDNVFVLSGVVPDEETKLAIEAGAELAYAPFNSSELVVDDTVEPAEWLGAAPTVVGLLPMITDGTIRLQDDSVTLVGRSPSQFWADQFAGAIGSLTGLPVTHDGIDVTGLVPPRFVAEVNNGKVTLEGEIPNQQLLETFIGGAAAVYGAENVTSTMTVDDGTYTSFWNYTIPGAFALLQPFSTYRIQVDNAVFSGSMEGAIVFELNSAELTEQAQQILPIGISLLARDLNLKMTIIGHTDNTGPDALNQTLSVERANAVVDFFVANSIDTSRLTAEGRGSSEPVASNETEEGRSLNRRVEFVFGY